MELKKALEDDDKLSAVSDSLTPKIIKTDDTLFKSFIEQPKPKISDDSGEGKGTVTAEASSGQGNSGERKGTVTAEASSGQGNSGERGSDRSSLEKSGSRGNIRRNNTSEKCCVI